MSKNNRDDFEENKDFELDLSFFKKLNFKKFNKKFWYNFSVFLLLLFVVFVSVNVRMQPLNLPAIDDSVKANVYNNIKVQIANSIKQQYPGVPDYIISSKVDEEFKKYISQPGVKEQINNAIKQASEQQKAFFRHNDRTDWAYMPDIDPYFWLRYAKNILYTGHIGYKIVDGKEWDSKQLAPIGREVTPDRWHAYFLAYWYKFLNFFNSDLTPERAAMYYPVFVYTLMAVLLFFIGLFVLDVYGAFFSSLTSVLIVGSLNRTLFGRADTDAWVLFFPVLTFFFFILSLRQKKFSLKILYALLSGFVSGLFSYAWGGWWYVPDFIFASVIVYVAFILFLELFNFYVKNKDNFSFSFKTFKELFVELVNNSVVKSTLIVTFVYSIVMMISVYFIRGNLNAIFAPFFALSFGKIKAPTRADFFPNVLTTVAELNPGKNFDNVINSTLGYVNSFGFNFTKLIFVIAVFGVFMLVFYDIYKKFSFKKGIDIESLGLKPFFGFLILVWFFAGVYASLKGIRFVLLLAPALSIAFGAGLAYIIILVNDILKFYKYKNLVRYSSVVLTILFLLIFFFSPSFAVGVDGSKNFVFKGFYGQAKAVAKSDLPLIDDTWISVFDDIKTKTSNDSIITSWWDFGHHFIYFTNRSVTFDGTTQDSEVAHWVGRLFLTNNENESLGILRMIDCSGSRGFYNIRDNVTHDDFKTLYLLKKLVLINNKDDAKKYLESLGYNNNEVNLILNQTHCDAPESVVIASADMIGKAAVWAHFGAWSFEKADVYNKVVRKNMNQNDALKYIVKRLNVSQVDAYEIYRKIKSFNNDQANAWISPWPSYYGSVNCKKENFTLDCTTRMQNNIVPLKVDLENKTAYFESNGRAFVPLMYLTKEGYKYSNKDKNPFNIAVALINDSENYKVVLSDPLLYDSMFTKLYYFDGEGLKCFNLLSSHPWPKGGKINTYTSNWTCKDKNVSKYYLE